MRTGWGGYSPGEGICLSNYYENIITYIRVAVRAFNILESVVFGTGIFYGYYVP